MNIMFCNYIVSFVLDISLDDSYGQSILRVAMTFIYILYESGADPSVGYISCLHIVQFSLTQKFVPYLYELTRYDFYIWKKPVVSLVRIKREYRNLLKNGIILRL
jgi:hypothetical protein